jgi:hypothetical protein
MTFDDQLDHWLFHSWTSGGPDPDCPLCQEPDHA